MLGIAWKKLLLVFATSAALVSVGTAEETKSSREKLREPVFRVTKIDPQGHKNINVNAHPLDPALEMARTALREIDKNIKDYTCTMVKRERVNGQLGQHEYIRTKIRHESDGTPFSVYMQFRKPDSVKGREVIYIKGKNKGKMVAHEGGWKGRLMPTVWLAPSSALAMRGNRYPATEIGIRNLCARLIDKGDRDRKRGECAVKMIDDVKINGRVTTCIQVTHPKPRPYFDFHLARIYVDQERNVPIRYEAYDWPKSPGGKPVLLEEYTYLNLKLNVGLSDRDFDQKNEAYNF